jgi:Winged helix-turn-helix
MNGAKKTHIVYEVNLNLNLAQEYLEMLKNKEPVRHENGLLLLLIKERFFMRWLRNLKFKLPSFVSYKVYNISL